MIGRGGMAINTYSSGHSGACAKTSGSVIRLLYSYNFATKKTLTNEILTSLEQVSPNLLAVSSDADLHLHLVQAFIMQLSCSSSCTSSFPLQIILHLNPTRLISAVERKEKISGELLLVGSILRTAPTATTDWRQ